MDGFNEELELEIDDDRLSGEPQSDEKEISTSKVFQRAIKASRRTGQITEIWVFEKKLKVLVIFEGRDSAGKGGAIKRIIQHLNPRVCRTVAFSAPNQRQEELSGIFSVTSHIYPLVVKLFCLTGVGITERVLRKLWDFVQMNSTNNFSRTYPSLKTC
jgi:polyphosphate kinase 2 (PPK2 family)